MIYGIVFAEGSFDQQRHPKRMWWRKVIILDVESTKIQCIKKEEFVWTGQNEALDENRSRKNRKSQTRGCKKKQLQWREMGGYLSIALGS